MKRTLSFAIAAMASALSVPGHAANYTVDFSGTVTLTQGTATAPLGSTISGQFVLVGDPGTIGSFMIDGVSAPAGFDSTATIEPSGTDAIYQAQISPVAQGGTLNQTFAVDLSSLTTWPSTDDAAKLLADTNQLTNNLDTVNNPLSAFPSTFDYVIAGSNGTTIASEFADLTSISVAVPEPASMMVLATALLSLGAARRRRRG